MNEKTNIEFSPSKHPRSQISGSATRHSVPDPSYRNYYMFETIFIEIGGYNVKILPKLNETLPKLTFKPNKRGVKIDPTLKIFGGQFRYIRVGG